MEVAAAKYWNRLPSELGLCDPKEDPAIMMAYYLAQTTMESYDNWQAQKKVK